MPRPLIGLGHSFSGAVIVNLALMHPRLFAGLVIIDPVMSRIKIQAASPVPGFAGTMGASSGRRDTWPNRADAERSVRKSKFYAPWDPRAIDKMVQHGFRDASSDGDSDGTVALTTTKHMECFTYYRRVNQGPLLNDAGARAFVRAKAPDALVYAEIHPAFGWYQPAPPQTAARLGELRPGVLYIVGADSTVCSPVSNAELMALTGYGWGGSGGAREGRVRQVVVDGAGHLVAMEKPGVVAARAAGFIAEEMSRWRAEEEEHRREWVDGVADGDKVVMSAEFLEAVRSASGRRKDAAKL